MYLLEIQSECIGIFLYWNKYTRLNVYGWKWQQIIDSFLISQWNETNSNHHHFQKNQSFDLIFKMIKNKNICNYYVWKESFHKIIIKILLSIAYQY